MSLKRNLLFTVGIALCLSGWGAINYTENHQRLSKTTTTWLSWNNGVSGNPPMKFVYVSGLLMLSVGGAISAGVLFSIVEQALKCDSKTTK